LEQPTRPVDLIDDGVDIDLPSPEEIERGAEILEKQQGSRRGFYRSRVVENGGPNLVDALHEVIQQAWTSQKGVLCRVYRMGSINSIVKTIEGFAS
jgi:hypothetical protein